MKEDGGCGSEARWEEDTSAPEAGSGGAAEMQSAGSGKRRAASDDQRAGSAGKERRRMAEMKNESERKGFKFTNDGTNVILTAFSDVEATEVVIPSHVGGAPLRRIGYSAFKGNERLTSVVIPDTVQHIENSAFRDCKNLTKVVAGKQLRSLGQYAFAGCVQLKSFTLPSSLQTLGEKTFDQCSEFTELIVLDMNKDGEESKRFVIASHNENRRWGYIQSSLIYFDMYNMRKFDEGYAVIHGFDDLYNIAEYRLFDDAQLDPYMRRVYENNIRMSIPHLIAEDQIDRLTSAGTLGLIDGERIDRYLEAASKVRGRCLAYLLDYKERNFKRRDMDFEL